MRKFDSTSLQRILVFLAGVLILKVTLSVMLEYRHYFPPDFKSDFLRGRQSYFSGTYQWAFYAHIAAGPVSLILGLILVSEQFRRQFPTWHRSLGKTQAILVLFLLAPSGLWMAYYAETGVVAAIGFSVLAIVTGLCVLMGWQSAVKKRFAEHRRWMLAMFSVAMLCRNSQAYWWTGHGHRHRSGLDLPAGGLGELVASAYDIRAGQCDQSTIPTIPDCR